MKTAAMMIVILASLTTSADASLAEYNRGGYRNQSRGRGGVLGTVAQWDLSRREQRLEREVARNVLSSRHEEAAAGAAELQLQNSQLRTELEKVRQENAALRRQVNLLSSELSDIKTMLKQMQKGTAPAPTATLAAPADPNTP